MKIAVPLAGGRLSAHFGHCEEFALVEVDIPQKQIVGTTSLNPPAHEPGVLPRWLAEQGAGMIIAGGMGSRAQALFAQAGIQVQVGAAVATAEELVIAWLEDDLRTGVNLCDH